MDPQNQGGPGRIPERWLRCPRKANRLIADKFLAFKTPLDEKFNDQIELKYRFTPRMLFDSLRNQRQKLGLWIDLTQTDRFYDNETIKNEFLEDGGYVKLACHGHKEAPTAEQVRLFINLCRSFISKKPLFLIGVHCTHGFNRTGFMIASFLIEEYDYSVEMALSQFAVARPPGIYKDYYIKELCARYHEEDVPRAPPLPDWCYDDGKGVEAQLSSMQNGRKRRSRLVESPMFMDGISGVEPADQDEANRIRKQIQTLVDFERETFVGSQPVSIDQHNIRLLEEKPYRVSWKADGTRYMMYIAGKDEVYFIDRNNSIFKVQNLQFFLRKCSTQHLTKTLLDGEMVIDKYKNENIPRYLVYDIVYFEGNNIGQETFYPIRLQAIQKEIIDPRVEAMKEGRIIKQDEPFSVRAKAFYEVHLAGYLLGEKFARQLTHPPDGLVFQPSEDPYTYGTSSNVLKWKPPSLNSIDFKLKVNKVERMGCPVEFIGDLLTGSSSIFGRIKCDRKLRALDGKIIECKYENKCWMFMRERTDKSFPNADKTVKAVWESIQSPITQNKLLEFIETKGWKDPMPPPMAPPPMKKPRTS